MALPFVSAETHQERFHFVLSARLLERAHSSDTALIFALKNYCQMRDRPEMATPDKDEVKEIRVSMGGKTVSQPKWMTC